MRRVREFDKPHSRKSLARTVIIKKIKLIWHPDLLLWTPTNGVEVEFEVYGTNKKRRGELTWETDLVKPSVIPHGHSTGVVPSRVASNLRKAIRSQLQQEEDLEKVRVVELDVIDYGM